MRLRRLISGPELRGQSDEAIGAAARADAAGDSAHDEWMMGDAIPVVHARLLAFCSKTVKRGSACNWNAARAPSLACGPLRARGRWSYLGNRAASVATAVSHWGSKTKQRQMEETVTRRARLWF